MGQAGGVGAGRESMEVKGGHVILSIIKINILPPKNNLTVQIVKDAKPRPVYRVKVDVFLPPSRLHLSLEVTAVCS